jgi:hypothetical protein
MINPDEITSQNNLQQGLNVKPEVLPIKFPEAPKVEVPPLKTEKYDPITQQFLKDQSGLLQQKTQVDVDTARTKLGMDAANLGLKSSVEKQYATDIRSDIDANQIKKDEYPRPEFHPTKENLASLGALFSMVSTLGMIVGSSGKMGANNAMNAMTGMLKGWQAGRKDLYEKEVKEFDKEYKRITDLRNEIEKQLEKSIQLRGIDKEAAYAAGQQAIALAGTNSVLGNMLNKGNVEGALQLLNSGLTVDFKVKEFKQKEEDARLKRLQQTQGNFQILQKADGSIVMYDPKNPIGTSVEYGADSPEAKRFFGSQKLGAASGAGPKATAKAVDGYRSKLIFVEDLNDMKKDLADPKIVNLLKEYRIEAFLTEEGKALNQIVNSAIPSELQVFLTKVRDIRNKTYLDFSGKAVTGGEALRSYGLVPQPGDDARTMINKIEGMQKNAQNQISFDQQFYGFPAIKVSPGERTNLIPGQNYSAGATDSEAEQALAWANANPDTPQAKAIKKRLGVE